MAFSRVSPLGSVRGSFGNSTATIKVIGVPQAIAKLKLVGSVAGREVGFVVRSSAVGVVDKARANVHSSSNIYSEDYAYTDNLKYGIQVTATGGRAGGLGVYTQAVSASSRAGGADREYAQFEEEGTSDTPAHPYLRPALNQQVPETAALLKVMAATLERL
jgi:HK97 gp10 family phage protein